MVRRGPVFARKDRSVGSVALAGALASLVGGLGYLLLICGGSLPRVFWIGRPLLHVQTPRNGDVVPQGGLGLRVTYPDLAAVAADTFRCELNGEDVTQRVQTLAENGADGWVFPLREGPNRLRVGVFGRSLWGGWIEDVVEI